MNGLTTSNHRNPKRTLDPIVTLLHPDAIASSVSTTTLSSNFNEATTAAIITSVCFLKNPNHSNSLTTCTTGIATTNNTKDSNTILTDFDDDDDDKSNNTDCDSSDSSSSPLQLQCATLIQQQRQERQNENHNNNYDDDTHDLSRRLLATCDTSGECYIWDIGRRQIIDSLVSSTTTNGRRCPQNGPGCKIRRLSNDSITDQRFFYQTRDSMGTISLHEINDNHRPNKVLQTISCYSQSFCSAAPCYGNSNLIVTPCHEHSYAMVRDWRMSSSDHPVTYFHGGTGMIISTMDDDESDDEDNVYTNYNKNHTTKKYGTVTSLAMSTSTNMAHTLIACGMENGSVVYHDLTMISSRNYDIQQSSTSTSISLSTSEPILALDMIPFKSTNNSTNNNNNNNNDYDDHTSSFVTVAGIAGNEEDLLQLPEYDRGRIAVLKSSTNDKALVQVRLRSRISTIDTVATGTKGSSSLIQGKPGIGQCQFRPDGRVFAVGCWDKRVRVYDCYTKMQNSTKPLAILRGHTEIVDAIDWSYDAVTTGLIATGSKDGKVHIWRCFPSKGPRTCER